MLKGSVKSIKKNGTNNEKGFVIVGDKKYGSKINPIGRLALHASSLVLTDPRNNKLLVLKSNIPKEITALVE